MTKEALENLDDLKKLCDDYFQAYNSKNLDDTTKAISNIFDKLLELGVNNEKEEKNFQVIKWIDSLPEEEEDLKFFLMDFMESAKDNKESVVSTKKNILDIISFIVKNKNFQTAEVEKAYVQLTDIIENLIVDGLLHVVDEISLEIQDIYEDESDIDLILSFLNEITIDGITERYMLDKIDPESKEEKVVHSTTLFIPVLLHSDKNILELPGIDDIEKIIKREVAKRYVASENEIHVNSFVLDKEHIIRLSYEQINDLVINGIIYSSGFYEKEIKEYRQKSLSIRGRFKELYIGVTLVLRGVDEQYKEFEDKAILFQKLFKNNDFLMDVSKKIKSPFSTFRLLPNFDWFRQEQAVHSVNALSNVFDILSEAKKNSEVYYAEATDKDGFYLFALDSASRSLNQSVGIFLPIMKNYFYDLIRDYSSLTNNPVYKYNFKLSKEKFQKIINSDNLNNYKDLDKLINNSTMIDREWGDWINVMYQPSSNLIH